MSNTSATGGFLTPTSGTPSADTDLEDLIGAALAGVTGIDPTLVRPRWQPTTPKIPAPGTDWLAFGLTMEDPDAGPALSHDPAAAGGLGADNYARHSDIAVLASFYGPNAQRSALLTRDGLCVPQNNEFLRANLITYVNSGTIRNVPEKVNEQWIRRYDLVLNFRRKAERVYPVENLLSADVSVLPSP